jgi:hypothetical protein
MSVNFANENSTGLVSNRFGDDHAIERVHRRLAYSVIGSPESQILAI